NFEALCQRAKLEWPPESHQVLPLPDNQKSQSIAVWSTVLGWCAVEAIGRLQDATNPKAAAECFDVLRLRGPLADAFAALGLESEERWRAAARVRASFEHASRAHAPY